jgi:hypothetical protein
MPKFGSRLVLTGLERSCCSPRDQRTMDRTDPIASRTGTESPVLLVLVRSGPSLFPVLRTGPSSTRPLARTRCSLRREVLSKACLVTLCPSSLAIHALASAAMIIDGKSIAGPRVMPSFVSTVVTPLPEFRALHPREVEATSVPCIFT